MANKRFTIAHVTHEAVEQIGGIGTVLEGLMTSPVYQQHVGRSILVGPTATHMTTDPEQRLGEHGQVLYSSLDRIDRANLSGKFRPVEWAFNVKIIYGKRQFNPPGQGRTGEAEVLLIDVFRPSPDRLALTKLRLWDTFQLDSKSYEHEWDYEEYVRLAEPAYYALMALMHREDLPCVLFSHEFMGMPAALQAIVEGQAHFRTVFHAHECATARKIVENHPGHDTMFYNVMRKAQANGQYVEDIFGDLDSYFRHALVKRSHLCDGIIAVGDYTRDELKFLDPHFDMKPIDLLYNGLPAIQIDGNKKIEARQMLLQYSKALLGYEPDILMTHVTRPVISKGLWRDLKVCHSLDEQLGAEGLKAVLYILTSGGGVRRTQDIQAMEEHYDWPRHHREGYPDLVGPEVDINRMIQPFNAGHKNVQIVLVNQFGWSQARIGKRLPKGMDMAHLRKATDVEFGMATYEPFGISPLEPLGSGAICVISNVCGCYGFVNHVTAGKGTPNVIVADFTRLGDDWSIDQLKSMTEQQRNDVEETVAAGVARKLFERLPRTDTQRLKLVESGQKLVNRMGWDQVVSEGLVPMLDRIGKLPANGLANGNGK